MSMRLRGLAVGGGAAGAAPCLILQDDVTVGRSAKVSKSFRRGRESFRRRDSCQDVQSVDYAGNITQDGQQNVDEEVGAAAALKEDSYGRQDNGKNDLANVAVDS